MQEQDSLMVWIIDDTGFLEQGKHSVGVSSDRAHFGVSRGAPARRESFRPGFASAE
jgi:hypothetical protein